MLESSACWLVQCDYTEVNNGVQGISMTAVIKRGNLKLKALHCAFQQTVRTYEGPLKALSQIV